MRKITEIWIKQAKADLKAAKHSMINCSYEWTCFQAQQSGEKALKACLYENGYTSILTHSLKELVRECVKIEKTFYQLAKHGRSLDMFYIPTRDPNGLGGDLAPTEFYEKEDGETCVSSAELILQKAKNYLGS